MNATPAHVAAVADLSGRVALVTGATSGIGRGCALGLAGAGAFVYATGRNAERGAETVGLIEAAGGQGASLRLDVTVEQDWIDALESVRQRHGRLDVLVNNAGDIGFGPLERSSLDQMREFRRINLDGPFFGLTHAWPLMEKNGAAAINIVSTTGQRGIANAVAYSASKGALTGLTKAAAEDGRRAGIRVNSIHPGAVWTEGLARMMNDTLEGYTAKMKENRATPLARPALPA
ncbi:MAG: SDR family oxidoreductase, partial [Rhodospirillaceae bacterium]|nr:SDR family oxidoreductase [Rhodospirillaceae bacterium]